jgi:protein-(glutamine-N5) methyltransferase, release factor-specific
MTVANIPTSIQAWLRDSAEMLADAGITSALLDAELILAHTVRKNRTWLHAHHDERLTERQLEIAYARLQLRLDRTPLAYIIGHREFYGRLFKVTPSVLIPRPESEAIITCLRKCGPHTGRLVDVGTGSGCLGITAKLELPALDVTLTDNSRHALAVARENATRLHAHVDIIQSDLLSATFGTFDGIIANLPYVDASWERSPETNCEPSEALFANNNGLALINKLLAQTGTALNNSGWLYLEADPRQHTAIIARASRLQLVHRVTDGFCLVFQKYN